MTTIISKSGTGVPLPDKLETAELAVDTSNGNLYTKLSDNSVVQINDGSGSGGGVEEAPIDTKQYARQDGSWSEVVIPDGGTGSSVHIGDTPPANPQEGQQWMEVPADGDATMWIYDGANWLQQPGGKDGADGVDGVDGLWTDNGDTNISYTAGNVGIGVNPLAPLHVTDSAGQHGTIKVGGSEEKLGLELQYNQSVETSAVIVCNPQYSNSDTKMTLRVNGGSAATENQLVLSGSGKVGIGVESPNTKLDIGGNSEILSLTYASDGGSALMAWKNSAGTTLWDMGGGVVASQNEFAIRNKGTARFLINSSGRVDITGSLYVNGTPKIGYQELITTLVTLRNATQDETTLEGLRDSIGNAIGGLIEKFEAEIAAMPAPEIPEASTQEISE
jgi:hypothetical protein